VGADRGWRYRGCRSDILQNAPFHSQLFTNFFASGGKGALTPYPKFCGRSCVLPDAYELGGLGRLQPQSRAKYFFQAIQQFFRQHV